MFSPTLENSYVGRRIRQTSRPDRTRSLPMLRFDPRYKDIGPKPTLDLFWIGTLEEQLDCLSQVGGRPSVPMMVRHGPPLKLL